MADPFISRDDLGDKLGLDLSVDEHALAAVDAACDMCRTISEQTFNRGTSTAFAMDGSGTEVQLLPEFPVNTVGTVQEDGAVLPATDYVLDPTTGSLIRVPSGQGYVSSNTQLAPSVVWNRGRQNIQVTYDHGWSLADIPRDVRMVALTVATKLFEQDAAVFETLGARSVRYASEAADLSANELRILHKYKRRR